MCLDAVFNFGTLFLDLDTRHNFAIQFFFSAVDAAAAATRPYTQLLWMNLCHVT